MAVLAKSAGVKLGHIDGERKLMVSEFAYEVDCKDVKVGRSTLGEQFDKQVRMGGFGWMLSCMCIPLNHIQAPVDKAI